MLQFCAFCSAALRDRERARFCGSRCRQAAYRRRAQGLRENARPDGRRGRLRLDQLTRAETAALEEEAFWHRVDEATRFPHGDGSYGNENTITVIDVGSVAYERLRAEYERKTRMAAVRRRWHLV